MRVVAGGDQQDRCGFGSDPAQLEQRRRRLLDEDLELTDPVLRSE